MSGKRRADGPPVTRAPKQKGALKRRVLKTVKWLSILGVVGLLLAAGGFYYLYTVTDIPDANEDFEAQTSFVYYAGGTEEIGSYATQNRVPVAFEEIPQELRDAVVAAENRTFWTDSGIDPKGIARAFLNNATGESTQGASTITQQYVKVLYLTQERSYTRKVKEAILSLKVARQQSKTEILTNYLNTIYFGRGAYGVQAAAQAYFTKDVGDLTLRESAVLASVLNNPTNLDPDNGRDARQELKGRYDYVLESMAELDMVEPAAAEKALKRLPTFPEIDAESTYGGQKGHVLTLVRSELRRLGYSDEEIDGGGLHRLRGQRGGDLEAAEDGVLAAKPEGFGDEQLHIAVASVEPGTGALRGFYGGQDYLQSQLNWAVEGGMVGSTFKPFALATAIQQGYSIRDSFEGNSPYEFPDGLQVRNEGVGPDGLGNDYGSSVDGVYAMEQSINTAFVDMSASMDDGPAKIYETAEKMGVPPPEADQEYPGIPRTSVDLSPEDTLITLGRARISPINMANSYATIANGGERADVHLIEKVVSPTGDDYEWDGPTRRALDEDIAADVSYTMEQTVLEGTGATASNLGRPAAGKTGTATNDDDEVSSAWFVGFTPQLSTAVMYVRGDGDDQLDGWLPSYFGSDYPTDTWLAVMQPLMEGREVEELADPVYVDGDAPDGQEDYVPPSTEAPEPAPTQPQPQPSRTPSAQPTPTEEPTPT
ncbi:MAG: penicillin-binding protein, partial [Nocardioides sp.]|nr:penicillin-binding protein [Nocardioides sp.]